MDLSNSNPCIMDGFNKYLVRQNITSIESYINIVRRFHNYIGKAYIDVSQTDVQNYIKYLFKIEQIKYESLYKHLYGINQFYEYLLLRGELVKNPCDKIVISNYKCLVFV